MKNLSILWVFGGPLIFVLVLRALPYAIMRSRRNFLKQMWRWHWNNRCWMDDCPDCAVYRMKIDRLTLKPELPRAVLEKRL